MRWWLIGAGALALAGCGQRPDAARETAQADAAGAPGVDVTAAPGVAFRYEHGFRLPSTKIKAVQEGHAQTCERLGIARCRITGMSYRLLGENNIAGELSFKLAPALARGFGRDGTAAVEQAGGTLVSLDISGTDTQPALEQAGTQGRRADDATARIDAQLARARTAAERATLQQQRAEAAQAAAAAQDAAAAARASLATTPVTFRYESGPAVRGFDTSAPFTSAINTGIGSVEVTLAAALAIIAIFGPPALLIGLVLWAVVAVRRRLRRRGMSAAAPAD